MPCSTVGEIYAPCKQNYVEWKIENYFYEVSQKADTCAESPTFHFLNASWCLVIYPNGLRSDDTVGWFGLHLNMEGSDSEGIPIDFTLGIKGRTETEENSSFHCFREDDEISGWDEFLERSRLLRNKYFFTPGGSLTVFCRAKHYDSTCNSATQTKVLDGKFA